MAEGGGRVTDLPVLDTIAPEEWCDVNGHMNITFYMLLVTRYLDLLTEWTGFGATYRAANQASLFVVETRMRYRREILVGSPVQVHGGLTYAAGKRLDAVCTIVVEGAIAADADVVFINADLTTRRARPLSADALAQAERVIIRAEQDPSRRE